MLPAHFISGGYFAFRIDRIPSASFRSASASPSAKDQAEDRIIHCLLSLKSLCL